MGSASHWPDRWDVLSGDLGFIEGPVWDAGNHRLSLVSIARGCVYHFDGTVTYMGRTPTGGGPNGMVLGETGLLVAQNGGIFAASGPAQPGVQRLAPEGVTYLFSEGFAAPNDLAFGPDGLLYVTDPQGEKAILEPVEGVVHACDLMTGERRAVIAGRLCPNGLAFSDDGRHLYLAHTQPRRIEKFRMGGSEPQSEGIFCELTNGRPDGLALDAGGRLWVCTPGTGGIEIFGPNWAFLHRVEIGAGSMTTNLCFGGSDGRDLFVTAAGWGQLLRLRADTPGIALSRGPAA